MDDLVAVAGQALAIAGAVVVAISVALVAPSAFRVRRRLRAVDSSFRAVRYQVLTDLQLFALQREEARALTAPWRRIWRVMRHPLVVEVFRWSVRRRRARASASRAIPQE